MTQQQIQQLHQLLAQAVTGPQLVRAMSLAAFTPTSAQAAPATKGNKPMTAKTAKTKSPDADCESFYYSVDLTITPALSDAKVAGYSNNFLKLKQTKTEDVQWDPNKVNAATGAMGDFVFVSEATTSVQGMHDSTIYQYSDYKSLKAGVKALLTLASSEGATLEGWVAIWNGDTNRPFRIYVNKGTVEVQAGTIGWPDGTQTPFSDPGNGGWI